MTESSNDETRVRESLKDRIQDSLYNGADPDIRIQILDYYFLLL